MVVTYFRCVKGATDASVGLRPMAKGGGGGAHVSVASGLLPAALEGLAQVATWCAAKRFLCKYTKDTHPHQPT